MKKTDQFVDVITLIEGSVLRPQKVPPSWLLHNIEHQGVWEAMDAAHRHHAPGSVEVQECLDALKRYQTADRLRNYARVQELKAALRNVGWPVDKLPSFARDPREAQLQAATDQLATRLFERQQARQVTEESHTEHKRERRVRLHQTEDPDEFLTVTAVMRMGLANVSQVIHAIERQGLFKPGALSPGELGTHPSPMTRRAITELTGYQDILDKPHVTTSDIYRKFPVINDAGWPRRHLPDFGNLKRKASPNPALEAAGPLPHWSQMGGAVEPQPDRGPFLPIAFLVEQRGLSTAQLLHGLIAHGVCCKTDSGRLMAAEPGSAELSTALDALIHFAVLEAAGGGQVPAVSAWPEAFNNFGWQAEQVAKIQTLQPEPLNIGMPTINHGETEREAEIEDPVLWIEDLRAEKNHMRRSDAMKAQYNHLGIIKGLHKIITDAASDPQIKLPDKELPLAEYINDQLPLDSGVSPRHIIEVFKRARNLPTVDQRAADRAKAKNRRPKKT